MKVRHEPDRVMTGRRGKEVKWLEDQLKWSCCGEIGVKRMKQCCVQLDANERAPGRWMQLSRSEFLEMGESVV